MTIRFNMENIAMRSIIKVVIVILIVASFVTSPLAGVQAQTASPAELAPLSIGTGIIVPNQYIVVLKPTAGQAVQASAISMLEATGGKVIFEYGTALNGFAAVLSDKTLLELRKNPQVDYIEADQVVHLAPELTPDNSANADTIQAGATWGLDRVDQHALPLNNTYIYLNTGAGVNVYVIDTGIRTTHTQFGGRASKDFDAIGDGQNGNDCYGHGTHVAGTIGGITYGVAKAVKLHAVRVLDCTGNGFNSGVIAGVNWVAAHRIKPAVANMSLGSVHDPAVNAAVNAAIATGVTFVVAAGNDNLDACNTSPASTPLAITVGATTNVDARSSFSNWGPCLDIFAPGSGITSAYYTSDTALAIGSGTSMASPHVAGAAALYLWTNPTATPATVANALFSFSTKNVVTDPVGSINRLLFSQVFAPVVMPTALTPVGAISDTTPTYNWTKIAGATQYQLQLNKGVALVYTQTILAGVCTTSCLRTPATVLPYAAYTWKVRAMVGGVWQAFSTAKAFTIIPPTIPTPITPSGAGIDTTPTYTWTRIIGATQYQYQLSKGATLVYTQTILATACGAAVNCASTPATVLSGATVYAWKVRALVGGVWKAFSPLKVFTLP
jgi:subtilisin family serine protease